jgi:hypothetical protein
MSGGRAEFPGEHRNSPGASGRDSRQTEKKFFVLTVQGGRIIQEK